MGCLRCENETHAGEAKLDPAYAVTVPDPVCSPAARLSPDGLKRQRTTGVAIAMTTS
jgi:hypothetical protein